MSRSRPRPLVLTLATTISVMSATLIGGCASVSRVPVRADHYRLEVELDPVSHRIAGRAVIDLRLRDPRSTAPGPVGVELLLHPALRVTGVQTTLSSSRYRGIQRKERAERAGPSFTRHLIELPEPAEAFTIFVQYEGVLFQDVEAGEKPGEIHNFSMSAHIAPEGIYLADGYWYPQVEPDPVCPSLSQFTLLAGAPPGVTLQASGETDESLGKAYGRPGWRSPYPLPGMVLVGGPHAVYSTKHHDVAISARLDPQQALHGPEWTESVARILDRYEPLIGPYPAKEFSVVANFFSSGFAFPCFTLLSSSVIDMGARARETHGYLDHEILHSWWGNGVYVDPRDGNWSEALATYMANYYGHVLDGKEEEARRIRRNYCHFQRHSDSDDDRPLGTFGRDEGCPRAIGYHKGAMVFHMLSRHMGEEAFRRAVRRFSADYLGRFASWEDIRRTCEDESGPSLGAFFEQWVRRSGAPSFAMSDAAYDASRQSLRVTIVQKGVPYEVDLPLRILFEGGRRDVSLSVSQATEGFELPITDGTPIGVELDPDYHLFRRVPPEDVLPTTARTRRGPQLITVLPDGDHSGALEKISDVFETGLDAANRTRRQVGELREGDLARTSALILGHAVGDAYVSGFLAAVEFPVRFTPRGFAFDGVSYEDAGDAVMGTVAHPGAVGGGITVVFANDSSALPPASILPMYDHSLVIFRNKQAVLKRDLEKPVVVPIRVVNDSDHDSPGAMKHP